MVYCFFERWLLSPVRRTREHPGDVSLREGVPLRGGSTWALLGPVRASVMAGARLYPWVAGPLQCHLFPFIFPRLFVYLCILSAFNLGGALKIFTYL